MTKRKKNGTHIPHFNHIKSSESLVKIWANDTNKEFRQKEMQTFFRHMK